MNQMEAFFSLGFSLNLVLAKISGVDKYADKGKGNCISKVRKHSLFNHFTI